MSSLMMDVVRTSETSVDNHFTRQYNPEDSSEHHTRRRENLKSHDLYVVLCLIDRNCHLCRSLDFGSVKNITVSQGSSFSIVSGYGLDDRAIAVRFPAEARGFVL
jgi:hypothetical protein